MLQVLSLTYKSSEEVFYISGGIAEVQPSIVTMVVDTVMHSKAIADEARRAAEENINKHADDVNFAQAQMELAEVIVFFYLAIRILYSIFCYLNSYLISLHCYLKVNN